MHSAAAEAPRELPGDFAMWMFIFAELTVFALLFAAYAMARAAHPAEFAAGQRALDRTVGLAETALLATSGYCVARARRSVSGDAAAACARWLCCAVLLGCGFALLRGHEFVADARRGITLDHAGVETAGAYWHMVDLLWLVLFFLVYVSH